MKKLFIILLAFAMMLSFAACKSDENKDMEPYTITTEDSDGNIKDMVKVEVPLESIDPEYQNDLKGYCDTYGYESAKLNKSKKTVTLKMKKLSYDLLCARVGTRAISGIYSLEDEKKTYKFLKKIDNIDSDNDFRTVTVFVDVEKYKKANDDSFAFIIAQNCITYQQYKNVELGVDIEIKDAKTKDTITTLHYPD